MTSEMRELHLELEEASSALSTLIAEAQACNHGPEMDRLVAKREGIWAAMTLVKARIRNAERVG